MVVISQVMSFNGIKSHKNWAVICGSNGVTTQTIGLYKVALFSHINTPKKHFLRYFSPSKIALFSL